MHLALPMRKSSNPPSYTARTSRFPNIRRSRVQAMVLCAIGIGMLFFIISQVFGGNERLPSGTPPVVIVTVIDEKNPNKEYIENIKANRIEYAKKHGYAAFLPSNTDYNLHGSPVTWSRVPAVRHALTKFPHSTFFWFLDQNALIMNPDLKVETHITNPKRLESLMLKNQPVVPPDSVIKTFSHLKGDKVDVILTQDKDGLAPSSFIVRRGDWARFFLDTWFDPLYRSYNFQKAETHALEHIVQWHPTILSKLVIIPQRTMNSDGKQLPGDNKGSFKDGDFVIRFSGCEQPGRDCVKESDAFSKQWRTIFHTR